MRVLTQWYSVYGLSPSLCSLMWRPTCCLPTTPSRASRTYPFSRVLRFLSGAPGAPPALLWCFLSTSSSGTFTGGQLRSLFRRAGPPPASPFFVVFTLVLGVALLSRRVCFSVLVVLRLRTVAWLAVLADCRGLVADLLRHTDTPMGRLLRENPTNSQLLGGGRMAGTLRSRVCSI